MHLERKKTFSLYAITLLLLLSTFYEIVAKSEITTHFRESITFIIQKGTEDQFVHQARDFFKYNDEATTRFVIDSSQNLVSIIKTLNKIGSHNGTAWKKINIVVHGNPWTGLSLPIDQMEERTTTDGLLAQIIQNKVKPLDNSIVDSKTTVEIKACGVGANADLLEALAIAFGGFDLEKPKVISSPLFIQYTRNQTGNLEELKYRPYYAFYKTAYRPAYSHIAQDLRKEYPTTDINWLQVLTQNNDNEERLFIDRFNVPIEWTTTIDTPFLNHNYDQENEKLDLVRNQSDLMAIIEKHNIPIEKFRWTIVDTADNNPNTILIKGKSTVLCVLERVVQKI